MAHLCLTLALALANGLTVSDCHKPERVGYVTYYGQLPLEATIEVRQMGVTAHDLPYPLPDVDGYWIVPLRQDEDLIGSIVTVNPPNGDTLRFLVIDCGGLISENAHTNQVASGWIGEVDHLSYTQYGARGWAVYYFDFLHDWERVTMHP